MPTLSYTIERIAQGVVEIHEEPGPYCMDEASILVALETVKAHREKYASPMAYQRRLELFEQALNVAREGEQS